MREETKRKTTRVEKCLHETGSWLQGDRQNRVPVLREGEQTPLPSSWWPCEQTRCRVPKVKGKRSVVTPCLSSYPICYVIWGEGL